MDLRPFHLSTEDIARAKELFGYQPFLISDDVITGVAHSWLNSPDPEAFGYNDERSVYERARVGDKTFALAWDANVKLMHTYRHFVLTLCSLFPGATYLDVSCSSGWFPVAASLNGMSESVGIDPLDMSGQFAFLNRVTGARARFVHGGYYPVPPAIYTRSGDRGMPFREQFDVVSSIEFLPHVADPLQFLYAMTGLARKAVFIFSGFVDTDEYLIRLNPLPKLDLTPMWCEDFFWSKFASGCAMSKPLLVASMAMLGFPHVTEIGYPADGLEPNWHERTMRSYQPHRAFLFVRDEAMREIAGRMSAAPPATR